MMMIDERTWEIVPGGDGSASRGGADRALRLRQFS